MKSDTLALATEVCEGKIVWFRGSERLNNLLSNCARDLRLARYCFFCFFVSQWHCLMTTTYVRATWLTKKCRLAGICKRATFDRWKYWHYSEFESVKDGKSINVHFAWGKKGLSPSKNSTSNFSKHLAKWHRNRKLADKLTDELAHKLTDKPLATTSSCQTSLKKKKERKKLDQQEDLHWATLN